MSCIALLSEFKKNKLNWLFLSGLPLFFLSLSLYNLSIQGPFYSFSNIDPSYAYLFNGFELLHFHAPGHTDHPGTTTQLFMAMIILVQWLCTAVKCFLMQQPIPSLAHLFFTEPDAFLYTAATALICLNSLLFSWVSFKLFSLGQKWAVLLAFQLGFLLFFPAIESFSMFSPEPMLLTGVLLLCLALFPFLFTPPINAPVVLKGYARNVGLALGFGMATKVTFLPLGLFLFLFPKSDYKKIMAYALLSFLMCTFPIWERYLNMFKWLIKIAFHQGIYGTGEMGLVDNTKIIDTISALFHQSPFLFISLIGLATYLFFCVFVFRKKRPLTHSCLILSLSALLFSLCLTIKHPGIRYLIPVLLWCGPICGLIAYELITLKPNKAIFSLFGLFGLFGIITLGLGLSAQDYQKWHRQKLLEIDGRARFEQYVQVNQCKIVGMYNPSMQSYGLYFGNQWANKKRVAILNQYYPNSVFFEAEQERFFGFAGPNHHLLNTAQVEQALKQYPCVVFQGQGQNLNLPPHSVYAARFLEKSLDNHQTQSGQFYEFKNK